jgi:hypothetical protein
MVFVFAMRTIGSEFTLQRRIDYAIVSKPRVQSVLGGQMKLEQVHVRFFRSFNYDYERKFRKGTPEAWEDQSEGWFPFVRVKIDPNITAVIGANEAGKTQLLHAVESAVTGRNIVPSDFCRYSVFYSVQANEVRSPEFGATFRPESPSEIQLIQNLDPAFEDGEVFTLFQPGGSSAFIISSKSDQRIPVQESQLTSIRQAFPAIFKLDTHLAMPDSLSISELAGTPPKPIHSRRKRSSLINSITSNAWSTAEQFGSSIFPFWQSVSAEASSAEELERQKQFELGRKLLVDIARIDPGSFARLQAAIDNEREGEIEGLIGAMNAAISENLNFHRWWTQDTNFDIQVKARERELALVIRDRTKASYSFDERSQGLRYFLSYFVQLVAHRAASTAGEIMLLDEPDAYLSSRGQQDFLRVLQDYAEPESGAPDNQVIYVTHSPFLIDRNAGHRLRVLDKGAEDEGTRVIRDATQNHYEPLRTSIGSTIAESAFIGGKNLFVEGLADQVLIAGMSNLLNRNQNVGGLNLNEITIVASGSASSLPYMVYLARGRGGTMPPCVALLDGDEAGKAAALELRNRLVYKRRLLNDKYIVEFASWVLEEEGVAVSDGISAQEIEDLVPVEITVRAARAYAQTIEGSKEAAQSKLTVDLVRAELEAVDGSLWEALSRAYKKAFKGAHIEKVGFAREVVEYMGKGEEVEAEAQLVLRKNFTLLLSHLGDLLDDAEQDEGASRNENRLARVVAGFERDHPSGIMKKRARSLLREIEQALDDSDRSDHVKIELLAIRRDFSLDDDLVGPVQAFDKLRDAIKRVEVVHRTYGQDDSHSTVRERTDS